MQDSPRCKVFRNGTSLKQSIITHRFFCLFIYITVVKCISNTSLMHNSYCNPRYLIIPLPFWYLFIQLFLKSSILLSVSMPDSALTTFVNHAPFVINMQMIKHKMFLHIIDAFCLFFICSTPFFRIFYPSIRVSHSNIPFYRFLLLNLTKL